MPNKRPREDDVLPPAKKSAIERIIPTLEEYLASKEHQFRWCCIVCAGPALEGSVVPGRICSEYCGLIKYF